MSASKLPGVIINKFKQVKNIQSKIMGKKHQKVAKKDLQRFVGQGRLFSPLAFLFGS